MRLEYYLEYNNDTKSPISIAKALIDDPDFNEFELMEIARYLEVHCCSRRDQCDCGLRPRSKV